MKQKYIRLSIVLLILGLMNACASPNMGHNEIGQPITKPDPGKAMVVFMRPSKLGFAIHAAVFEDDNFIAMVPYNSKFVHMAKPGKHQYMVVSEAGDFMSADLVAGKTYYAIVAPRMGAWRARFSLQAVRKEEISKHDDVQECLRECQYVVNAPSAAIWAQNNKPSIMEKKAKYYEVWMEKNPSERPHLRPEDGQ